MEDPNGEGIPRREFLRRAGVVAAGLGLAACAPAAAPTPTTTKAPAAASPAGQCPAATPAASEADAAAKLYEAAKKEGQVMAYAAGTAGRGSRVQGQGFMPPDPYALDPSPRTLNPEPLTLQKRRER